MMRIIDEAGNQVEAPDLDLGHLVPEEILVAHHPAIQAQPEVWHYDKVAEYANGGVDVVKVVDSPEVAAKDAWDEYEDVLRYILYTQDELDEIAARKSAEEEARKKAEEEAEERAKKQAEQDAWLSEAPARVNALEEQQLNSDEAIAALYESMLTAQLDTDEAIAALYEAQIGGM